MKRYLFVVALAVSPACGKHNDAQILQHQAEVLVKYYKPKLTTVATRIDRIMERGKQIPGDAPGVRDLGARLQEAHETYNKLKAELDPKENPSPVLEKAKAAASERNIGKLEQLVAETEETIEHGLTVIDANLDTIEAWLYQYDAKTLAMATPAAPSEPALPDGQAAPAPGQPAAEQTGAPPAGATPAGATPPADSKQPAAKQPADAKQPAAKQPAATQPATAQPAAKQAAPTQPATTQPATAQPAAKQPAPAKAPAPAQPASH